MGVNKYNISSDNVIYSVNEDGTITKLARIEQDGSIASFGEKKANGQEKNSNILGTVIVLLVIGLIVFICICVNTNDSNNYLRSKVDQQNSEINDLKGQNESLKEDKEVAESALTTLKNEIGNNYPLIITDILIGNMNSDSEMETDYGNTIYSSNTMYLIPKIEYYGIDAGYKTIKVKWIMPDGSMSRGSSSPYGFSQSGSYLISSGSDNSLLLGGWGNANRGYWQSGTYRIEIWYENSCLKSKTFTIY